MTAELSVDLLRLCSESSFGGKDREDVEQLARVALDGMTPTERTMFMNTFEDRIVPFCDGLFAGDAECLSALEDPGDLSWDCLKEYHDPEAAAAAVCVQLVDFIEAHQLLFRLACGATNALVAVRECFVVLNRFSVCRAASESREEHIHIVRRSLKPSDELLKKRQDGVDNRGKSRAPCDFKLL